MSMMSRGSAVGAPSGGFQSDMEVRSSVGSAMDAGQVYSPRHPFYVALESKMLERVTEMAQREGLRKSSAKLVINTVILDSEEASLLASTYPEFSLITYPMNKPGHAYWVAARKLANEWIAMQMRRRTDKFTHLGGSLLSNLIMSERGIHLELDMSNDVAVHDYHTTSVDVNRIFTDFVDVGKDLGRAVDRHAYNAYLSRQSFSACGKGASCMHHSEGFCADLSVNCMSPAQFASAMLQCHADVGYGFFIYHPTMLVASEGVVPGTNVWFEKTDTVIRFKYTEGAVGVLEYPLAVWSAWLTNHYFQVGSDRTVSYQLELMKNRDWFMFFRVTKVAYVPRRAVITHALDLPSTEGMSLVRSWKLKSLTASPQDASSWEPDNFISSTRVISRVYEFGMQLTAQEFTRYAIRKQLKITNDRVVLQGSAVTVTAPLSPEMIDKLSTAIFSRLFVDRYESGRLSKVMMDGMRAFASFGEYSYMQRVSAIALYCVWSAWDVTFGLVDHGIRTLCDNIRRLLGSVPKHRDVNFTLAPTYVTLVGYTSEWRQALGQPMESISASLRHVQLANVNVSCVGAALASVFQKGAEFSTYQVRQAAVAARLMTHVDIYSPALGNVVSEPVLRVNDDIVDVSVPGAARTALEEAVREALVTSVRILNEVDEEPMMRFNLNKVTAVRGDDQTDAMRPDYQHDPDPVSTMNSAYDQIMPGVSRQNLEFDTASISLDPQDRSLAAVYLKLPGYFGEAPVSRPYYHSRIKALNVPKRQGTMQELLSANAARTMAAPQIALQQDNENMFREIWDTFLSRACIPEAKQRLKEYQADPVAIGIGAYKDWMHKATPASLKAVKRDLEEFSLSLAEKPVNEYLVMLKSDVKPTLSIKPIEHRTEPQVIVYHEKTLSSLYSCMFRVLVERLLSILKPNIHLNLKKDVKDIRDFVQAIHPFSKTGLRYLENDFSKYDKSQGSFAFGLEEYIFQQLGLNSEMLDKWVQGHVDCSLRSVSTGLSLHVVYQRKSGDATTAFGNGLLNIVSVVYAYRSTRILWGVFMGDDSLICTDMVGVAEDAIQVLAEVFNLTAKNYITDAPYFASNFFLIDDVNEHVAVVPDPIKRIEKLSMHIAADEPMWAERYESAKDTLSVYRYSSNTAKLAASVAARYNVPVDVASGLPDAIATIIESFSKFRSVWEDKPIVSNY